jgi:alkylation response protein AidB-like acyl-CoA dehydrogenase
VSTTDIRAHVRAVLADLRARGVFTPGVDSWIREVDPEFSAILGAQGWIGLTWPVEYGGQGRSYLDRFVVLEELLIGPRRRPPRRPAWPPGPRRHGHHT